jgi:hypothetical protein
VAVFTRIFVQSLPRTSKSAIARTERYGGARCVPATRSRSGSCVRAGARRQERWSRLSTSATIAPMSVPGSTARAAPRRRRDAGAGAASACRGSPGTIAGQKGVGLLTAPSKERSDVTHPPLLGPETMATALTPEGIQPEQTAYTLKEPAAVGPLHHRSTALWTRRRPQAWARRALREPGRRLAHARTSSLVPTLYPLQGVRRPPHGRVRGVGAVDAPPRATRPCPHALRAGQEGQGSGAQGAPEGEQNDNGRGYAGHHPSSASLPDSRGALSQEDSTQ